jgi:hypothetical protein
LLTATLLAAALLLPLALLAFAFLFIAIPALLRRLAVQERQVYLVRSDSVVFPFGTFPYVY